MCVYDRLFLYNLTFRAPPGHHGLHEKMAPMFVLSSSLFCLSVFVNFPFSITIPGVLPGHFLWNFPLRCRSAIKRSVF